MNSSMRLAGALLLAAMSASVFAGDKATNEVNIQALAPKPFASGDLGYVRNTPDTVQYIGCQSSQSSGSCWAKNAAGEYKTCVTSDAAMLAVIRSLNGDGHLMFGWNGDGSCREVRVTHDSRYAPK